MVGLSDFGSAGDRLCALQCPVHPGHRAGRPGSGLGLVDERPGGNRIHQVQFPQPGNMGVWIWSLVDGNSGRVTPGAKMGLDRLMEFAVGFGTLHGNGAVDLADVNLAPGGGRSDATVVTPNLAILTVERPYPRSKTRVPLSIALRLGYDRI